MLKKLLIATAGAALAILSAAASANGNWSLGLYFGFPAYPAYVAPPPAYYYPPPRVMYYSPPPVYYAPRYYAPPYYGPPGHYQGGHRGWNSGGHPHGYGWR